ncbi:uncharacterized protein LAJ45_05035 [Morchella importuna]|uniref:uncharacterized protein n=1 Tax=Morchella importuna TaxID=1174673 RepID=UPI001E8D4C0D|nr:uncharacterized protein LAJ45_05035 [Morchella importuna]KAH8150854.1 hypothetical protein LAJ45_05035 [Morchella importuna]
MYHIAILWLSYNSKIQVTAYGIVTTRWCFCFCFFVFVSSVFEWLVGWLLGLHSWLLLDMVWTSIHFSADRFVLQLEMTGRKGLKGPSRDVTLPGHIELNEFLGKMLRPGADLLLLVIDRSLGRGHPGDVFNGSTLERPSFKWLGLSNGLALNGLALNGLVSLIWFDVATLAADNINLRLAILTSNITLHRRCLAKYRSSKPKLEMNHVILWSRYI